MNIYSVLVHAHSGLRWIFLVFLIVTLWFVVSERRKVQVSHSKSMIAGKWTMILMHLQLLIGLTLYFISPKVIFSATSMKDSVLRFFLVEHISLMLIALVLITLGYIKAKRAAEVSLKLKKLGVYYLIAFILILLSIPWPFRNLGAGWF